MTARWMVAAIGCATLALPASSQAADFYASDEGSGTADCFTIAMAATIFPTTIHRIDPVTQSSSTIAVWQEFPEDVALAPAATIGFVADAVTASEKDGKALVDVSRTGGAAGAMTVGWTAGSGSAVAGQDFPTAAGTVAFADGEMSKTIEVPLTNDTASEGRESLLVELGEPVGNRVMGAVLGRDRVSVVIEDDDVAPVASPTPGATPQPDTTAPLVRLAGIPRTIRRASFLRGFVIRATPNEASS